MPHPILVNTLKQLNSKIALYCKLVDVKAEDISIRLRGDIYYEDSKPKDKPTYFSGEYIRLTVKRNWNLVEYEHHADPYGSNNPKRIKQIRQCYVTFGEK